MTEWEAFLAVGLIMVGILLFSPTSDIVYKVIGAYQSRFGLQPKLVTNSVSYITVNGEALDTNKCQQFIQLFNQADFLCYEGYERVQDTQPFHVHIQVGNRSLQYSLFHSGKQIRVVRHKKNEAIAYRIASAELADWLLSFQSTLAV